VLPSSSLPIPRWMPCPATMPNPFQPPAARREIAMQFGKGRVIVLGEAAMMSAQLTAREHRPFGMNVPGIDNRQLALNIMH